MDDTDDPKGVYNREPVFKGENYAYQKENMYVHLLLVYKNLRVTITEGPFIPRKEYDKSIKHLKDQTDDQKGFV